MISDIQFHNNLSEWDIREYVIKRKISGSTRSEMNDDIGMPPLA